MVGADVGVEAGLPCFLVATTPMATAAAAPPAIRRMAAVDRPSLLDDSPFVWLITAVAVRS